MPEPSAVCRDGSRRVAVPVVALILGVLGVALGVGLGTDLPWEPTLVLLPLGALALWRWRGGRPLRELTVVGTTSGRALLLVAVTAAAYALLGNVLVQAVGVASVDGVVVSPGGVLAALAVSVLVGGLLTAVPEELVFRGVALQALLAASGPRVAIGVTSALFALLHLPNALLSWEVSGWLLGPRLGGLLVLGSALAWVTLRSGTIWVAVAWHAAANVADTAWAGLLTPESTEVVAWELWRSALATGEAALLVCLVALRWPPRTSAVPSAAP